ncbi:ATP-binding cassette domain-containing protein [Gracilibacillus salitolerans]|uniref:ATP-binding cassette domain-containing protein n=1 Tax=Gracilibacillus salitolerans TaxID=2663022 RepID=A0A5Q2TKB4_9BACI|nr:ATP-binding cassette domain-containing protein [Gracilibacillus salitolerans]QGH35186.1 ATP-binding cassette domain-containing protein [Gracilibacillus salitolerans]
MFSINQLVFKDIINVSKLEIESDKIYCLFGESGSGKSTLLKMFNSMLTPDQGKITYKGESIADLDPVSLRKEVVMLGQDPVVFEGTVRHNLLIGLQFSGEKDVEDQVLIDLLRELHLTKDLDEEADKLSGGEQQRLAFGRVLLMNAEVYLMDEPTSALDENTEIAIMDLFTKKVRDAGKTAIMVTHSKEVAEKYSDEIIYMNDILTEEGALS